jgi:hypothetical protein
VFKGGWSFKKSSDQNGEPIIVLFILFWLAYVVWRLS